MNKIQKGCAGEMQSTEPGGVVYLQNDNFPQHVTANTGCECYIETDDCDAHIIVYTIQRVLEDRYIWELAWLFLLLACC